MWEVAHTELASELSARTLVQSLRGWNWVHIMEIVHCSVFGRIHGILFAK
jgi:hypothetical protein